MYLKINLPLKLQAIYKSLRCLESPSRLARSFFHLWEDYEMHYHNAPLGIQRYLHKQVESAGLQGK